MSVLEVTKIRWLLSCALIATFSIVAGCGDEDAPISASPPPPPVGPVPMSTYAGAGSNWNYDLFQDGTFSLTRATVIGLPSDLSVSGSYQTTAAGFLQMTVGAASGTDAPQVGATVWAIEVPDYALLLSPISTGDNQMIPMIQGSQCPGTDLANNWISVQPRASSDATSANGSYFGSFSYTNGNGGTQLISQFALADGFADQGTASLGFGVCRDGVISNPDAVVYLAGTGGAVANIGPSDADGGIVVFALPKSTVASIDSLDGSYIGIMADRGAFTSDIVSPVSISCTSGICIGDLVTDVVTGVTAGQPFILDLFGTSNDPGPGFITGSINISGVVGNIACMVDDNVRGTGQRMISCAGQSPTKSYEIVNLILASTD